MDEANPYIVSASLDFLVRVHPVFEQTPVLNTGRFLPGSSQVNRLSVINSTTVAICMNSGFIAKDFKNGSSHTPYQGQSGNIMDLAVDENKYYTCSDDKSWAVWDSRFKTPQNIINTSHALSCLALYYSKDYLIIGNEDGQISLWNINENKIVNSIQLSQDAVRSVAASKIGNKIIALTQDGSGFALTINNGVLQIFKKFEVHHDVPLRCIISPDETMFLTTSADSTAKLWDFESYEYLQTLVEPDQKKWVWDAAFTNDSRYVCTAGTDATIRTWDIENGQCIFKQSPPQTKGFLAISMIYL